MFKRILIVDDHIIAGLEMSFLLEKELNDVFVIKVDDFKDALSACAAIIFDLVILDIKLPDGSKCGMIDELRELQKDVKILIFSAYEEDIYAFRYIQAGANGYVNKFSDSNTFIKTVNTVLKTGKYISSSLLDKFIEFSAKGKEKSGILKDLTQRELEIAELLVRGYGKVEVANELGIKKTTVSGHQLNIFRKTSVNNIIELSEMLNKLAN